MITKKQADAIFQYAIKTSFVVIGSFASWALYMGTDYVRSISHDVQIIKQDMSGFQERMIEGERRNDRIEQVVNSHAVEIQNNKLNIREIQVKLRIK